MQSFNTDIQLPSNDWTTSLTENQWLTELQPNLIHQYNWFGSDPNSEGSYQNQTALPYQASWPNNNQTAPPQQANWQNNYQTAPPQQAKKQKDSLTGPPNQAKKQKNNQTGGPNQVKKQKNNQPAVPNHVNSKKNNIGVIAKAKRGKRNKNKTNNDLITSKVARTDNISDPANYTSRQKKERPIVNEENKYYGYFKVEAKALNVYGKYLSSACVQPHDVNALAEEQARFQYYFVVKNFAFAKNHSKKKPPELRQGRGFNCNACDEYFFIKSNLDKHRVSNAHYDIMLLYDGFKKIGEEWFAKFQDPTYELPGWVIKAETEGIVFETGAEKSQSGRYKLKDVETTPITDDIFKGIDVNMNLDDFILATYDNIMEVHWPRASTNFFCRCCNCLSLETEEQLKEHIQSDQHQEYEKNYDNSWCTSCQRHTGSAEALAEHINTSRHSMIRKLLADTRVKAVAYWNRKQVKQTADSQGKNDDDDGDDDYIVPVAGFICNLCDAKLATYSDVAIHKKTAEHQGKLKLKKPEAKAEEAAGTSSGNGDTGTKKNTATEKVTNKAASSLRNKRPQAERRDSIPSLNRNSSRGSTWREPPRDMDVDYQRDRMRLIENDLRPDLHWRSRARDHGREEQFGRRYDSEMDPEFSGYRDPRYLPRLEGGHYPPPFNEDRYLPRFGIDRYPPRFGIDRYSPRFDEERYLPLSEAVYELPARSDLASHERGFFRRTVPLEERYGDYPPIRRDFRE